MKYFTYMTYITGYAVFWMGHSGWWFLLAYFLGCSAYSPLKWIYGMEAR